MFRSLLKKGVIVAITVASAGCGSGGGGGATPDASCPALVDCSGEQLCETELQTDPRNCGGCGIVCAPDTECISGTCSCDGTICDGTCVDTSSDPEHCGECGADCNGICTDGSCSSQIVLRPLRPLHFLDFWNDRLYWTHRSSTRLSTGALMSAPSSGGEITPLLERLPGPEAMRFTDNTMYFVDFGSSYGFGCRAATDILVEIDLATGDRQQLAADATCIESLWVDEESLVWIDKSGPAGDRDIVLWSRANNERVTVAQDIDLPSRVRFDDQTIYWLEDGQLASVPRAGGTISQHPTGFRVRDFLIDDDNLYLVETAAIQRWSKASTSIAGTVVDGYIERPIAVVDSELFFVETEQVDDGTFSPPERDCLKAAPISGGAARSVACTDAAEPMQPREYMGAVAIGPDYVYWSGGRGIYRAAR